MYHASKMCVLGLNYNVILNQTFAIVSTSINIFILRYLCQDDLITTLTKRFRNTLVFTVNCDFAIFTFYQFRKTN